MLREIIESDLPGLLQLYTQLHDNPMPQDTPSLQALWQSIRNDPNHHIFVAVEDGRVVSSCVLIIVPNLTHHQRPYGLIENVITDSAYRRRGLASDVLACAKSLAVKENCYKLMLLTGSKEESTLSFYRRAGYNSDDKTGFIQWL